MKQELLAVKLHFEQRQAHVGFSLRLWFIVSSVSSILCPTFCYSFIFPLSHLSAAKSKMSLLLLCSFPTPVSLSSILLGQSYLSSSETTHAFLQPISRAPGIVFNPYHWRKVTYQQLALPSESGVLNLAVMSRMNGFNLEVVFLQT